jgi:thiol-disulfide isomerase/thioredoxin
MLFGIILAQSCSFTCLLLHNEQVIIDRHLFTLPLKGQDIPVWKLADLQKLSSENDSTTYVINFWATWCGPCVKELPYFEDLNKTVAEHNIQVVLVSLDFADALETRVKPFVQKRQLKSRVVLLDEPNYNKWLPLISEKWSGSIPATLCINKSKGIYEFVEGQWHAGELRKWLKRIGAL